ncbi:MAG: riboflavin biosynthesis protein RibF [Lachnospiraceae bacterium]|nr:riboflavin biosynthesis protein RibF [Lachnospiraceae bacterium]
MKIIRDLNELKDEVKIALAIGKFDGLHLGHQKLLAALLKQKEKGFKTAVLTFAPPPEVYFGKGIVKQLLNENEKEALIEAMGIDILIYFPMDKENAVIPAKDFVEDILLKKLKMGYLCAGSDLRFGAGGKGNSALIVEMAKEWGFLVEIVEKIFFGAREISSSYVREAVEGGAMGLASQLLGRPYSFSGTVKEGLRLGRTLGFPTANLSLPETKVLPPNGVYLSKVMTSAGEFKGISNIGVKPTIEGGRRPGAETYIYDFAGDLYGTEIQVFLEDFIRPEKKFASIEELKEQVNEDIRAFSRK